jgi:hypothetical protein
MLCDGSDCQLMVFSFMESADGNNGGKTLFGVKRERAAGNAMDAIPEPFFI